MYISGVEIKDKNWNSIDDYLISYVSTERKEKIKSYYFAIDKKLSLYAALLVRMELSILTKIPTNQLIIKCDGNGKPFIASDPQYNFNISHTKCFVLCSIVKSGRVGVDVEKIGSVHWEVVERCFNEEEKGYVLGLDDKINNQRFFEVWTKKEAYIKFLGKGIDNSLNKIDTLSKTLSSNYISWLENSYLCTVYSSDSYVHQMKIYSEKEIVNFYLYEQRVYK